MGEIFKISGYFKKVVEILLFRKTIKNTGKMAAIKKFYEKVVEILLF